MAAPRSGLRWGTPAPTSVRPALGGSGAAAARALAVFCIGGWWMATCGRSSKPCPPRNRSPCCSPCEILCQGSCRDGSQRPGGGTGGGGSKPVAQAPAAGAEPWPGWPDNISAQPGACDRRGLADGETHLIIARAYILVTGASSSLRAVPRVKTRPGPLFRVWRASIGFPCCPAGNWRRQRTCLMLRGSPALRAAGCSFARAVGSPAAIGICPGGWRRASDLVSHGGAGAATGGPGRFRQTALPANDPGNLGRLT